MNDDIAFQLKGANEIIPINSMWDGFWIMDFEHGILTITCSFDRLSYRNFDIVFTNVSFFNIPTEWLETSVSTSGLFREASAIEFLRQQPDFRVVDKSIFALDLTHHPHQQPVLKQSYYIVADTIKAFKCELGDTNPHAYYKNPFPKESFPCLKNKIPQ